MTRSLGIVAAALAVVLCLTDSAQAQTRAGREKEFVIGGSVAGPMPVGSGVAELIGGSGSPTVTLFRAKNTLALGYGVEVDIGVALSRSFFLEVSGGWSRSEIQTRISEDFEDAPDQTISSPMSRFVLEGAMVRYLGARSNNSWFVRIDGGWMRETAGRNTLVGDGLIGGGGIGFRHWWRTAGKGSVKRLGLRIEGRAVVRSGGISIGEKGIRIGPAGTALLVFGY